MKPKRNLRHSELAAVWALVAVTVFVTGAIDRVHAGGNEHAIPVDAEAEATLLASVGNGFSLSRSDHFVLVSDVEPARLTELRLLDRVELTFARVIQFCRSYGLSVASPSRRLELVCLSRREDYGRLARSISSSAAGADGFYDYSTKRSYFTNRAAGARGSLVDQAWWIVVRHESVHQILDHIAPTLARAAPDWLSEGLACAFETVAGDEASDRPINSWRLLDATRKDRVRGKRRFTDIIREDWHDSSTDGAGRAGKYARAWAVVAYLRAERSAAFGRYLRQLATTADGAKPSEQLSSFERIFGSADARMDAAIATYTRQLAQQINTADGGSP